MTRARLLHALRCALAVGALAGFACACGPALPPTAPSVVPARFAVRLHRAQKPGDRGTVSAVVRSQSATIVEEGDRVVKREEESREVALEATEKVLEVDAKGEAIALEYTVASVAMETPAGRREVVGRGQVVVAERGREAVTFRGTEALSPAAEKAFGQLVLPRASETTDDELFGTTEPQAIGAVWPANAARAAKELEDDHLPFPVEGVSGQTRLVGLAQADGRTCLEVTGELSASAARPAAAPGAPSETVELRTTYRRLLPVDAAAPELDATLTTHVEITVVRPAGPNREARTTMITHEERRRRFTPLP